MAGRRPSDKPLSEPMVVELPTHICVTRPHSAYNTPVQNHVYLFTLLLIGHRDMSPRSMTLCLSCLKPCHANRPYLKQFLPYYGAIWLFIYINIYIYMYICIYMTGVTAGIILGIGSVNERRYIVNDHWTVEIRTVPHWPHARMLLSDSVLPHQLKSALFWTVTNTGVVSFLKRCVL